MISFVLLDKLRYYSKIHSLRLFDLPSFFLYRSLTKKVFLTGQGYLQNPKFQLENIHLFHTCISTPNYLQTRIDDQVTYCSSFLINIITCLQFSFKHIYSLSVCLLSNMRSFLLLFSELLIF